jgi:hypothetical protein
LLVGTCLVVAVGAITTVVQASIPDSAGVIHGCYSANGAAATNGTPLNIIDSSSASCSNHQTPILWSQTGPPGTNGTSVTSTSVSRGDANCANGGSKFTAANNNITYACNGAPGAPASSILTSGFDSGEFGGTGPVSGLGTTANGEVTELSPAYTVVATNLDGEASTPDAPGGIRTWTLLVNGQATALTCTNAAVTESQTQSCMDTTDVVTIPPGSELSMQFSEGGSNVGSGFVQYSFVLTPA